MIGGSSTASGRDKYTNHNEDAPPLNLRIRYRIVAHESAHQSLHTGGRMLHSFASLRSKVVVNVSQDGKLEMVPGDDGNSISYYVPRVD